MLNKVALSVQVKMKADLREIYGAPTRAAAEAATDLFADKYGAKYDCLGVVLHHTASKVFYRFILRFTLVKSAEINFCRPSRCQQDREKPVIEYRIDCRRWASDLVRRQVAVIATLGGNAASLAAKPVTTTTPVVCYGSADPVE